MIVTSVRYSKWTQGNLLLKHLSTEEIITKLEANDHKVDDYALAAKIVSALLKNYSHFTCTWNAMLVKKETKDNLVGLLFQEELGLTEYNQEREGIAFHMKTKGLRKLERSKGEPRKELVSHFGYTCV
jgi:hypothetical protein